MRKIDFKLNLILNYTVAYSYYENDTHILIQSSRSPSSIPFFYTVRDLGALFRNQVPLGECARLQRQNYSSIMLDGAFSANENIVGSIYIGTWGEILIVDLFINLMLYYQYASTTKIEFQIGIDNDSNLFFTSDSKGNFTMECTLMYSPTVVYSQKETFDADSDAAFYLKQIYDRIITNQYNEAFVNRQTSGVVDMQKRLFQLIQLYSR